MPEPEVCVEIRRLLARHGLPRGQIEAVVSELAEHWEDLNAEASGRGLSETNAAAYADARLGAPGALAADVIASLRHGCGLGRHPLLAICLLPLLLPLLLMGLIAFPLFWVNEAVPDGLIDVRVATSTLSALYYASMFVSLAWISWRSWRSGLGIRWVTALCSWFALTALLRFFDADPIRRNVVVGLSFPWRLNSHTLMILALHGLVAAWFLFLAWRSRSRHAAGRQSRALSK